MSDKVNQLQQLARMLEAGQITQVEFDALKSELLVAGESEAANPVERKPLGWYRVQSGDAHYEAFWDGEEWTGATRTGATRSGVVVPNARKPLRKRVGFWLLMILVVAPMFAAVAGIAIAGLTVASASSSDAPRASESQTTSTTTPKTPTTTRPRTTTTTRPRPATTQDNVDWDGVAAALDRWPGVYGEALSDVWDTTNCEDLAFDVQFAMDYLTFPNQAQADSFTTDLALVAYSRAERINCTLNIN